MESIKSHQDSRLRRRSHARRFQSDVHRSGSVIQVRSDSVQAVWDQLDLFQIHLPAYFCLEIPPVLEAGSLFQLTSSLFLSKTCEHRNCSGQAGMTQLHRCPGLCKISSGTSAWMQVHRCIAAHFTSDHSCHDPLTLSNSTSFAGEHAVLIQLDLDQCVKWQCLSCVRIAQTLSGCEPKQSPTRLRFQSGDALILRKAGSLPSKLPSALDALRLRATEVARSSSAD